MEAVCRNSTIPVLLYLLWVHSAMNCLNLWGSAAFLHFVLLVLLQILTWVIFCTDTFSLFIFLFFLSFPSCVSFHISMLWKTVDALLLIWSFQFQLLSGRITVGDGFPRLEPGKKPGHLQDKLSNRNKVFHRRVPGESHSQGFVWTHPTRRRHSCSEVKLLQDLSLSFYFPLQLMQI